MLITYQTVRGTSQREVKIFVLVRIPVFFFLYIAGIVEQRGILLELNITGY